MRPGNPASFFSLLVLALFAPLAHAATITGRVKSAETGDFLRNARVVVEPTGAEVLTDEAGHFAVPTAGDGAVRLRVSYAGMAPETVEARGAAPVEVVLHAFGRKPAAAGGGGVLQLDAFTVNSRREMSAGEMAINEKRIAPNNKDVLAIDSFGNLAQDNLGEFLQFLPGVEVETDGNSMSNVGLRGMSAEYTNIELDGAGLAIPVTGASSRITALRGLSISNVDRVEVTKGPTPDTGADSIGGRINMVPRSSFERSRPEFRYRTFVIMNSEFLTFRKTPGGKEGGDGYAYKWFPNFEVSHVNPVSRNFGYSVNASRNDYFTSFRILQRAFSTVSSTPEAPYLTGITGQAGRLFSRRSALGAKADFRVTPRSTVSVSYNFNRYYADFGNNQMNYATGTILPPAATGPTAATGSFSGAFTQGRPGQGSVTQLVTQNAIQVTQTHQGQVTWRHRGPLWEFEGLGALSKTKLTYRVDNYGQVGQVRLGLTGVTVRFDDIASDGIPGRIRVADAAGNLIDTTRLANLGAYTTPAYNILDIKTNSSTARFDARRKFAPENFSWSAKSGVSFRGTARDRVQPQTQRNYTGPAFGSAQLPVSALIDDTFNLEGPNGMFKTQQWLSPGKAYDLYQANPSYFTRALGNEYIQWATSLVESSEKIYAGYAMADASFWRDRVRLAGGVRYERTAFDARGALTNLQLQFQRDAAGNFIDGNPNQPGIQTVPITTDGLEIAKLTRLPLANRVAPRYGDFYPSINGTVTLRENLLLRLGYAHVIGRPAIGQLTPTTTVTEVTSPGENASGAGLGTIVTSNPDLKPWSGRNHDVALEYYTRAGGLFSIGGYLRDITDFISTVDKVATAADLAELGISDDYAGFLLRQPQNTDGDVRQTGLELSARQRLFAGFSVFANYSRGRIEGLRAGDLANAQTRRFNAGFQLAWRAVSMTANYGHVGLRRGAVSGIAPGAFVYTRPRDNVNLSVEYQLRRNFAAFATMSNLLNTPITNETYGGVTPPYARLTSDRKDGSQIQFGIKGSF